MTHGIKETDIGGMSTQEIIQSCSNCGIDMYRTVVLVLKKEWQVLFADAPPSARRMSAAEMKQRFNPDTGLVFDLFEMHEEWSGLEGYTKSTFNTMIQEMILSDIHMVDIDSIELEKFIEDAQKPLHLLRGASREAKEAFWIKKQAWLEAQETLGETLLLLERRRLENANVARKWMVVFGKAYLALQEQIQRYRLAIMRLELLDACPELSRQQLEEKVRETERGIKEQLRELKIKVLMAPHLSRTVKPGAGSLSQVSDFRTAQKKILREIWLLIHPDRLLKNRAYKNLTDSQKEKLDDLWHNSMKIRPEEIGFDENQVGFEYRSLSVLADILSTAKVILKNAGIHTDVSWLIQGNTIDEQMEWLQHSTEHMEYEIENAAAQLKVLFEDKTILERSALLSCDPQQQETVKSEMFSQTKKYRLDADRLERKLAGKLENQGGDK